jgi:hypothetical protein
VSQCLPAQCRAAAAAKALRRRKNRRSGSKKPKLPKPARTLQGGFLPEFRGVISDKNQWKDMVSLANRKTLFFVLVRWSAGGWKHETIQQFGKPTDAIVVFGKFHSSELWE